MSWRDWKSVQVAKQLASAALTQNIPFSEIRFKPSSEKLAAHLIEFQLQRVRLNPSVLHFPHEVGSESHLDFSTSRSSATTLFSVTARHSASELIGERKECEPGFFAEFQSIGDETIFFQCAQVFRESFLPIRREPRSLLFAPAGGPRPKSSRLTTPKRVEVSPGPKPKDLNDLLRWLLTPPIHEVLSDPDLALPCSLFDYQMQGVAWLHGRESALLADEMGLGKTVQAIMAARLLFREQTINQFLVVCPKSLIENWRRELCQWWPGIGENCLVVNDDVQTQLRLGTPNITVKLVNYERLAREADWLEGQRFEHDLIIIDEAQRIKNSFSKTAKAVKALRSRYRWALTGTPLENDISDLHSVFDFVKDGLLSGAILEEVPKRIRPYLLRRRADEVQTELPEMLDQTIEIDLAGHQKEAYVRAEEEGVVALNSKGDSISITHVFTLIKSLMQLCNFEPVSGESGKIDRLLEDLEEIAASDRKALIFSQFVSEEFGLKRIASVCEREKYRILQFHGDVSGRQREAVLAEFRADPAVRALLLNYRVGGVGLNLQEANYVYLFDRWWNPAVEDQAIKRAHRIGQIQKVFVRRFFCVNTIEERILRKLHEKRRLFAHIIDENRLRPEDLGLTTEEVFGLFPGLIARPNAKQVKPHRSIVLMEQNLNPDEFEELVARVYEGLGYSVERRGGSGDGGIDLVATTNRGPHADYIVIQCKHTKTTVGRPVLQQLWGVVSDNPKITRGIVVTSSSFSNEAAQFASGKRLDLVDGDALRLMATESGAAELR